MGKVIDTPFIEELTKSYQKYAISVVTARAIPSVKDGLLPVQRRILYSAYKSGYGSKGPTYKSAKIVGDTMGNYHPHGDSSIYDALVRMAQPWSMRAPLIHPQGNFGSPADPPAAQRYTEAKLSASGEALLAGINEDGVDMTPTYDAKGQEPVVLPATFPNLLVNGGSFVAVGVACSFPPHNPNEVADAVKMMIDNPDATVDDILTVLPGPDFPTGGTIHGASGVRDAFTTGRGKVTIRAVGQEEKIGPRTNALVFTEIPYRTNSVRIRDEIINLIETDKLPEVTDVLDEAGKNTSTRLVVKLRSGANAERVKELLYSKTSLQTNYNYNMRALVGLSPKLLGIKDILQHYINHRRDVVIRRAEYRKKKAESRQNIVEGHIIAQANIDRVVEIIRNSETPNDAYKQLQEEFGLNDEQTTSILEMQLRRLTKLDADKLQKELEQLKEKIAGLVELITEEPLQNKEITKELDAAVDKNDTRHTPIKGALPKSTSATSTTQGGQEEMDTTPLEIYIDYQGNIHTIKPEEYLHEYSVTNDTIMVIIAEDGTAWRMKASELPNYDTMKELHCGESTAVAVLVEPDTDSAVCFLAAKDGKIKRLTYKNFAKRDGLPIINNDSGVIYAGWEENENNFALTTKKGKTLVAPLESAATKGRTAGGLAGIELDGDDDELIAATILRKNTILTTITDQGNVKSVKAELYPEKKNRGSKGVRTQALKKSENHIKEALFTEAEVKIGSERTSKPVPLTASTTRTAHSPGFKAAITKIFLNQ